MTLRKKQIQSEPVEINTNIDIPNTQTDVDGENSVENDSNVVHATHTKSLLWNITNNKRVIALVLIAIVVPVSSAFYFHWFNLGLSKQEIEQRQVASVVSAVGKLMIVPKGTPILATVKDALKLKQQQSFFRDAQDGDDLVIFPQSNRAIIYSPSRNLIINVGPVKYPKKPVSVNASVRSSDLKKKSSVVATANAKKITIDVRNGSTKNGLASSVASELRRNSLYSVTKEGDASSQDYKKNLVVDIAKKSRESSYINSLANSLNATVVSVLPSGEKSSSADVVIILGSNG